MKVKIVILTCDDCPAPYGEDGWCDVIVPNEIWNRIAPEGGLLCFRCMTKRIIAAGLTNVPVIVASGPYVDANETWRLIGWEHGHKVGHEEKAIASSGHTELLETLQWIASQENLTFAECSLAEEIIGRAKTAIAKAESRS